MPACDVCARAKSVEWRAAPRQVAWGSIEEEPAIIGERCPTEFVDWLLAREWIPANREPLSALKRDVEEPDIDSLQHTPRAVAFAARKPETQERSCTTATLYALIPANVRRPTAAFIRSAAMSRADGLTSINSAGEVPDRLIDYGIRGAGIAGRGSPAISAIYQWA